MVFCFFLDVGVFVLFYILGEDLERSPGQPDLQCDLRMILKF